MQAFTDMTPKVPMAAKVLRFFIKIGLFPVRKNKDGNYELQLLSCRFVSFYFLWHVVPFAVSSVSYVSRISQPADPITSYDFAIGSVMTAAVYLELFMMPVLTSFLVAKASAIPTWALRLPNHWLHLLASIFFNMVGFFSLKNGMADTTATNIVLKVFIAIKMVVSFLTLQGTMFVINMYFTSFIEMCKHLAKPKKDNINLNGKVQSMLAAWQALKKGMSPMALMLCTVCVTALLTCSYLVSLGKTFDTTEQKLYLLAGTGMQLIFIFNVCCISQECLEEFLALKNVLR